MIDLMYITSASYSGSTLLTFLLAANPRIATVGELKATQMGDVDKYKCSCGELIRYCGYWRTIGDELVRRGAAFDVARFGTHFRLHAAGALADRFVRARVRGPAFEAARALALRMLPGAAREFGAILERNRLLVETISGLRGTSVFLDGSKEPNRLKYLIDSGLWNVKVLHLVRDGRGVAQSLVKRALLTPPAFGSRRALIESVSRHWRRVNAGCEKVVGCLSPESWVRIRYEDLCRDPETALVPALRLIGEGPMPVPADFRTSEHHILGNYMRLRPGRIALDERWRSELSGEDLAIFDRTAGDLNRRYGYV